LFYLITRSQSFYNFHNKNNLIYKKDKFKIPSLVIKKDTSFKTLSNFIKKYKNEECSLVLMFHSAVSKPSNPWEWSKDNFEKLCKFISTENITCKTLREF
jgi:hypothetical protein